MQQLRDGHVRIWFAAKIACPTKRVLTYAPIFALAANWILVSVAPAAESFTAEQVVQVVEKVRGARDTFSKDASIENEIHFATWLMLFAEISMESDQTLFSQSRDAFEEGGRHLAHVHNAIQKDPQLQRRISTNASLAMRLDAAQVRQQAIGKRKELARTEELKRLRQLRELVQAFRDATRELSRSNLHFRTGDFAATADSTDKVLSNLRTIYDVAGSRKDYYLFFDEPQIAADADYKLIRTAQEPFTTDTISYVKALHALSAFQLAKQPAGGFDDRRLADAQTWATAALRDDVAAAAKSPPGADENNILAHYVLGQTRAAQGVSKTRSAPFGAESHANAAADFAAAREQLSTAQKLSRGRGQDIAMAHFNQEVDQRVAELASDAPFLERAANLTSQGQLRVSRDILLEGLYLHRSPRLVQQYLESSRRLKSDLNVVFAAYLTAVRSAELPRDAAATYLVGGKILLEKVWLGIARPEADQAAHGGAASLREDRVRAEQLLRAGLKMAPQRKHDPVGMAEFEAFLALAIAYEPLIVRDLEHGEARLKEAYQLARDSEATLKQAILRANLPAGIAPVDAMDIIAQREALIASRLALGHVGLRILPDYRDEPMLAFAAAFDETARLPFAQADLKAFGSPFVQAVTSRSGESGTRLAQQERQQRHVMSRFVEAAYALHFGEPEAAAAQAMAGLRLLDASGAAKTGASTADAAELLAQADGFDARLSLPETLRAFVALSEIAAGRPRDGLREILGTLVPESIKPQPGNAEIDLPHPDLLRAAAAAVQSPLTGYTLGVALEANIDLLNPKDNRLTGLSLAARAAYQRAGELLEKSPRLRSRYGNLVISVRRAIARLDENKGPQDYLAKADAQKAAGNNVAAARLIEAGVRRHRQSGKLIERWVDNQMQVADQQLPATAPGQPVKRSLETNEELIESLSALAKSGNVPAYAIDLKQGAVYERMGKLPEAVYAYNRAAGAAKSPRDKIIATSKSAALRARLELKPNGP